MTLGRLAILLGAAVMMFVPLPDASAADSALPNIDLQLRCRKSEATLIEMMGNQSLQGTAFDGCIRSEEDARKALLDAWKDVPQAYKSYCVRKADYSPSYVEWIACLELAIDLRKQRAATSRKPIDSLGRCPMIRYAEDGSIIRVVACAL
jgi:hypothetical protein